MRRLAIAVAMILAVVSLAAIASADTLFMRDGTRVQGTVVGFVSGTIMFRHADGVLRRYPTSQVQGLEFISADRTNPRAMSGRRLEAPAGTELVVRTVETIDSRNAGADQIFSAIVERDVTDGFPRVLIPENSSAQLMIRQVSSRGPTGSPEMAVDIQSITIEGRRYLVSTTDVPLESGTGLGKNKRTVETFGAGAALGTIVGAVAGGGAAAQVLTKGRDVKVPAETVLTFRLDRSVMLRADQ